LLPVLRARELSPWFGKQPYVTNSAAAFNTYPVLFSADVNKLLAEFMVASAFVTRQAARASGSQAREQAGDVGTHFVHAAPAPL
jgi:hypothetical protein